MNHLYLSFASQWLGHNPELILNQFVTRLGPVAKSLVSGQVLWKKPETKFDIEK